MAGEVPGEPHCDVCAGAGQVAVAELTPLLCIVVTALCMTGSAVSQLATVNTSFLSESRWVEVGEDVVVEPGQEDLAAGVVEPTVTAPLLARHVQ